MAIRWRFVRWAWALCLLPALASGQSATTGAIAGFARDASGGVLPGVTVEAASPSLIEGARVAVTDDNGQYRIVDLRPGTYSVSFSLPGFSVLRREGVELTTGFTASVSAELSVGGLEETITVSGASPIVDVQNVQQQNVLSRETLDSLPTGRTYGAFAAVTLGVKGNTDVGGNRGEASPSLQIHNSRTTDSKLMIDGMNFNHTDGAMGGSQRAYFTNAMVMQEVALSTGSNGAEWETSGVNVNFVPKDGGNRFQLNSLVNFTDSSLQASNLDDHLRSRGLTSAPEANRIHDAGIGIGGPLVGDRLWYYGGARHWQSSEFQPGAYWNRNPIGSLFYVPDTDRRGATKNGGWDTSVRLTLQPTPKNRVQLYASRQNVYSYLGISSSIAPEAASYSDYRPQWLTQGSWTSPLTARILLEAGAMYIANNLAVLPGDYYSRAGLGDLTASTPQIVDSGLGITYGNATNWRRRHAPNANGRFSVSYITGSHNTKAGLAFVHGVNDVNIFAPDLAYTFRNQLPISLTQFAMPRPDLLKANALAMYAQDAWTIQRMTLNLGVRFDALRGSAEPVQLPGGRFLAAASLPAVTDVPNFKDIVPRLGGAYDVFGDGRTAIKGAIGKYVVGHAVDIAIATSPSGSISASTTRTWNDSSFGGGDPRTGNFVPDCDLTSAAANGECGAMANRAFGTVAPTLRYADDVRVGWGVRDYSWVGQASIQQELVPGVAISAAYYRTWYGNLPVTKNLATTPDAFSPYCVSAPSNARLPGGGGNQLCGLYDVSPAQFGQVDNVVTQASRFGNRTEVFNGVDVSLSARIGNGAQVNGGVSLGQTVNDACAIVNSPQEARPGFCRNTLSWWEGQGQVKFSFIYPLMWGLQTSGTYQNLAGAPINATFVATNAQIAPSLGRNLAAGVNGTVSVPVIPPNTVFEDRLQQLDLRLSKTLTLGRTRVQGSFDVYNVFNGNAILGSNPAIGSNFLVPTSVLGPRIFKFQIQLDL